MPGSRAPAVPLRPFLAALALVAFGLAAPPARAGTLTRPVDPRADALAALAPAGEGLAAAAAPGAPLAQRAGEAASRAGGSAPNPAIAALKSLVLPGWGQWATGHRTQAAVFGALEFGTWVTYGTFQRQGALRKDSYFLTALLGAGIDLHGKPESYRVWVGQYKSSDVYNQYVVLREAAYFYDDSASQAQFIAAHHIPDANAWSWSSFDDFLNYRAQRRSSEQAYQRARYALGFAVVNRIASAIAAARQAAALREPAHASRLDAAPGHPVASLGVDLAPGPGLVPDARLACVVRF